MDARRSRLSGNFGPHTGVASKGVASPQVGGVFGVAISKAKSHNKSKCDLPGVVDDCVKYLETKGLQTEKIFTQTASILQVDKLRKSYDTDKCVFLSKIADPHIVSSLLKLYLSLLPEPLLPWSYFCDETLSEENDEEYGSFISSKIEKINSDHKAVLKAICLMLRKFSLQSHINHMTSVKLAEVFAPLIFSVPHVPQSGVAILDYIISHSHSLFNSGSRGQSFNHRSQAIVTPSSSYASSLSDMSPTQSDGALTSRSDAVTSPSDSFRDHESASSRVIYSVRSSTSLYASLNSNFTQHETVSFPGSSQNTVMSTNQSTSTSVTPRKLDKHTTSKTGVFGAAAELEKKSPRNISKLQSPYPSARPSKEKSMASPRFQESTGTKAGVRRSVSLHDTSMTEALGNGGSKTSAGKAPNFCRLVTASSALNEPDKRLMFYQEGSQTQQPQGYQPAAQDSKAGLIGDLTKIIEELKQERDRERQARISIEEKYLALLKDMKITHENSSHGLVSRQSVETQTHE